MDYQDLHLTEYNINTAHTVNFRIVMPAYLFPTEKLRREIIDSHPRYTVHNISSQNVLRIDTPIGKKPISRSALQKILFNLA